MNSEEEGVMFTQGSVEESLFIPLIVKEKESKREDSIFTDLKAIEIMGMVDLDTSRFEGGGIADHGILVRTTIIDSVVNRYLKNNENGIIINLGAGLDTRIERVDNDKTNWYDVDLPEVIELRRRFFNESERITFIPKSVLDSAWTEDINVDRNEPILIIAEGLLMYFSEEELKSMFKLLIETFPNAEMCFDIVHKFFVGKGISSKFRWGIRKAKDIRKLNTKIKLIRHWSTGDYHKFRQERFFRIMNVLPSIRNRSQILHVKFTPEE